MFICFFFFGGGGCCCFLGFLEGGVGVRVGHVRSRRLLEYEFKRLV